MYIGETRRTVHERINELRQTLNRSHLMPWNDPHTAAPSLWAWQDAEGYEYECSATPLDASQSGRRGMDTEMRNKNFLPISPFSNERYLIV